MEHQLHRHRKPITCEIISRLLVAMILVASCQARPEGSVAERSLTSSLPDFTYSTYSGAIWQVDINGHKTQLLPGDGVHKSDLSWSPDRHRLAYVALEYVQNEIEESASIQKTLFVVDGDASNQKHLAGPAQAIQYIWVGDHIIDLRLTHKVSDGSERQQWEQFLVDVETGAMNPVEQAGEYMTEIVEPSPDARWMLLFDAAGDTRWLHLLDAEGNKVSTIYTGPFNRSVLFEWSPNSRYVFYLSHTLYDADDVSVYDLSTGKATKITHFVERGYPFVIWSPCWSPTGEWISFWLDSEGRTNQPCVVSLSKGSAQCFDISAKTDRFAWSANGQYLAFLAPRGNGPIDLYAVDAKKGELINLTNDGDDVIEFEFSP